MLVTVKVKLLTMAEASGSKSCGLLALSGG